MGDENEVDVIVPVHNSTSTLRETIASAMNQEWMANDTSKPPVVFVCCYNDGSSDDSWEMLQALKDQYESSDTQRKSTQLESFLVIANGDRSRGAGAARNRAAALRNGTYLCWLDSDDVMHPHRIYHQLSYLRQSTNADAMLLGSGFERIPADSTTHYTQWANSLEDKRLYLERFREITIIQPTWMMKRTRFESILRGYMEAPLDGENLSIENWVQKEPVWRLYHSSFDTRSTLRVAEDLRFFMEHLESGGVLAKCSQKLLSYRHTATSQTSLTPRKLLLALRVVAFERVVLSKWEKFIVWGAGRDGKDFIKALTEESRGRVYCIADVDETKIARGYYETREWKIPIVHFSVLAPDESVYETWKSGHEPVGSFHRIEKHTEDRLEKPTKRQKLGSKDKLAPGMESLNAEEIRRLPVVVCVSMYRTNGALEANVDMVKREEGVSLWYFN